MDKTYGEGFKSSMFGANLRKSQIKGGELKELRRTITFAASVKVAEVVDAEQKTAGESYSQIIERAVISMASAKCGNTDKGDLLTLARKIAKPGVLIAIADLRNKASIKVRSFDMKIRYLIKSGAVHGCHHLSPKQAAPGETVKVAGEYYMGIILKD